MSHDAADTSDPARSAGCGHCADRPWTAGADDVRAAPGGKGHVPAGRLHAVVPADLLTGRALCGAPVALLDPAAWRWPDDGAADRPLCWACLELAGRP